MRVRHWIVNAGDTFTVSYPHTQMIYLIEGEHPDFEIGVPRILTDADVELVVSTATTVTLGTVEEGTDEIFL